MDPFTLSTGMAGFVSLSLQIAGTLQEYISSVASAKDEAQRLLTEVEALRYVLTNFVEFLRREDAKGISFRETSGLCSVVALCRSQLQFLYQKLAKVTEEKSKASKVVARMKWPFSSKEISRSIETLSRCKEIFHFSLSIDKCSQMSKSRDEITSYLKNQQVSLKQTSDLLASMNGSVSAEITAMSRRIEDMLAFIPTLQDTSAEIHRILSGVQSLRVEADVKLLEWISPLEPPKRHQDVRAVRVEGTGRWLLEEQSFQDWCNSTDPSTIAGRVLCCYGIPGAGKTVMTSLVIDHIAALPAQSGKVNYILAYVYCDYRDQANQTPRHLLGSLLRQAVATLSVPDELTKLYEGSRRQGRSLDIKDVQSILVRIFSTADRAYICIDAFDECKDQEGFLKPLREILSQSSVRLFITGRPHVENRINRFLDLSEEPLKVNIEAHQNDIKLFISEEIEKDRKIDPSLMDEDLKSHILEKIGERSQKMFLLPALQIREVLDECTKSKRRQKLRYLPKGLHDAYTNTIERISKQPESRAKQAMIILMWAHLAERPMGVDELYYALAVDPEAYPNGDRLDLDNLPSLQTWLDGCHGLVVVDEETSTVRLVHFSLEEFLREHSQELFPQGQGRAALACVYFLLLDDGPYAHDGLFNENDSDEDESVLSDDDDSLFSEDSIYPDDAIDAYNTYSEPDLYSENRRPVIESLPIHGGPLSDDGSGRTAEPTAGVGLIPLTKVPFFRYASSNWGHHMRKETRESDLSERLVGLAARLLQEEETFSRIAIFTHRELVYKYSLGMPALSRFHVAAHFGITPRALKHPKPSELGNEGAELSPMSIASINGYLELVRFFVNLREEAGPYLLGRPLCHASRRGRLDVVKFLVGAGADIHLGLAKERSPLHEASRSGNLNVVRFLTEIGADVNRPTHPWGKAPLHVAAGAGHLDIVRFLAGAGAQLAAEDDLRDTPLHDAAGNGNVGVVKFFVEEAGVNVNLSPHGKTPLHEASEWGHSDVVRVLVEAGADLYSEYSPIGTPLHMAVQEGRLDVVKVLVRDFGMDVNITYQGSRPLHSISRNGGLDAVRFLVEAGAEVDPEDGDGRTPLFIASGFGKSDIVRFLVEHGAEANTKDRSNITPLHWASRYRHRDLARFLVEECRVEMETASSEGQTPLHWASLWGSLDVVMCLVKAGAKVNVQDNDGATPLHAASDSGELDVVEFLVKEGGAEVDSKDKDGATPLNIAVKRSYRSVAKFLINEAGAKVDAKDRAWLDARRY